MPLKLYGWHIPRAKLLLILVLASSVATSQGMYAQQSQLRQQISEPDCSDQKSCELQPPTITSIDPNNGYPIITGTYDAGFTKNLRAIFGGEVYILGTHEQLTARDGQWRLNMYTLPSPLESGLYDLIIEAEGYDGEIEHVRALVTIPPRDNGGGTKYPDEPGVPKPIARPESSIRQSFIVAASTASVVILFAAFRRKHR